MYLAILNDAMSIAGDRLICAVVKTRTGFILSPHIAGARQRAPLLLIS